MRNQIDTNETKTIVQAAMYVRMSTEHQKYSTENQEQSIREYAKTRNIEIVETYADEGKSGLDIEGRQALKQLINDVENNVVNFSVILVLDITRWGRFQDTDESAYYEFICRSNGVDVQYVAEQFKNDGSPTSAIIKSVKRAMAGEYSRELSVKVFQGQCRLIKKGFRQGGPAGYGLRRMLIDEKGSEKGVLKRGEHKSLQTDRVILVPGPQHEIENVCSIYQCFVDDNMSEKEIADQLNKSGIQTDLNRTWSRGTIHQVLTNEKYVGNNVYNRTSSKLKKQKVNNDPDLWIRADGAFKAIVETKYFYLAQEIIRERSKKLSDEDLLSKLSQLREHTGWLSGILIDEMENMLSSSAYRSRFGSLIRAYALIGYKPERDYRYIEDNQRLRQMHPEIITVTAERILNEGGSIYQENSSGLFLVNGEISVSIIICRCVQTKAGNNRWKLRLDTGLNPDITIAIRMMANNKEVLDYYLLPALDLANPRITFKNYNELSLDTYRYDNLEYFFILLKRTKIQEAA